MIIASGFQARKSRPAIFSRTGAERLPDEGYI